ncbi:MAG: acyl-[acyl-carrier-protein] thioesterase [Solirubrobacterales bacterium]
MDPCELTELVGGPAAGRVFEDSFHVGGADAGPSGRVRLDAIARWLQDLAFADIVDSGFEQRGLWILRRLRIRVESFPRFGDKLALRTFCSGLGRFSAERRSSIGGDAAKIEAVALWILLDPEAGRPVRFDQEFIRGFAESANGREANVRLRHPGPPHGARASDWSFRPTDLDLADHVNNSHYWVPLEEQLGTGGVDPGSIDAEIEFHHPARIEPVRVISDDAGMWITSPDGTLHASILISRGWGPW